VQLTYPIERPTFLTDMFAAGEQAGASAVLPWELTAWHVSPDASGGFDFGTDDPSYLPVEQMISFLKTRVSFIALLFRHVERRTTILSLPALPQPTGSPVTVLHPQESCRSCNALAMFAQAGNTMLFCHVR